MSNLDAGWKQSLQDYFQPAVALLFPDAHRQIDWSRGYEFLDKELRQIAREGDIGVRIVDKLVKIWLKNGGEQWVLLHIDIQGQPQREFARRMFIYHIRIFDRYGRCVASFAILADPRRSWRPREFGYNLLGCKIGFEFPIVKLLDFAGREAELQASSNPFAVVVLAFLSAQRHAKNARQRKLSKIALIRSLYDRGLARKDVARLFGLIDWFIALPADMEKEVWREVEAIEKEKHMRLLTPREQSWLEEGQAKGQAEGRARTEAAIALSLRLKFGKAAAASLAGAIRKLTDAQLDALVLAIESAHSPDELFPLRGRKRRVRSDNRRSARREK